MFLICFKHSIIYQIFNYSKYVLQSNQIRLLLDAVISQHKLRSNHRLTKNTVRQFLNFFANRGCYGALAYIAQKYCTAKGLFKLSANFFLLLFKVAQLESIDFLFFFNFGYITPFFLISRVS